MNIRLPAPLAYFSQENEAQTRRAIEQALAALGTQGLTFFSELETGSLDVSGAAAVGGALAVTGASTFSSTVDVTGNLSAADLSLTGGDIGIGSSGKVHQTGDTAINTSTFTTVVAETSAAGFYLLRDTTNGGVAVVLVEGGTGTVVVVGFNDAAGTRTKFVNGGTPAATEIGLQLGGGGVLQAKGGSSRNGANVRALLLSVHG